MVASLSLNRRLETKIWRAICVDVTMFSQGAPFAFLAKADTTALHMARQTLDKEQRTEASPEHILYCFFSA